MIRSYQNGNTSHIRKTLYIYRAKSLGFAQKSLSRQTQKAILCRQLIHCAEFTVCRPDRRERRKLPHEIRKINPRKRGVRIPGKPIESISVVGTLREIAAEPCVA